MIPPITIVLLLAAFLSTIVDFIINTGNVNDSIVMMAASALITVLVGTVFSLAILLKSFSMAIATVLILVMGEFNEIL